MCMNYNTYSAIIHDAIPLADVAHRAGDSEACLTTQPFSWIPRVFSKARVCMNCTIKESTPTQFLIVFSFI